MVISAYSRLNYHKLLMDIGGYLLIVFHAYFISGHWCLLY